MNELFTQKFVNFLIRFRNPLGLLSMVLTAIIALGAQNLYFEADYKVYFQDDDPQLMMHESVEDVYTSSDNIAIALRPDNGDVFTQEMLALIFELSERLWQTPYVMRVDSITNFQHTSASGDDLLVEDIVLDPTTLNADKIKQIRKTVLAEKQLFQRLISADGTTSLLNVNLELPPEVDSSADLATQAKQRERRDLSYQEVGQFGGELLNEYRQKYPQLTMHVSGVTVITNSFNEVGQQDAERLAPIMYGLILVALTFFLRSIGGVIASLMVIAGASIAGIGSAGWFGYSLNTVNVVTPTIVLTIAVCDAVHLLAIYLRGLSSGLERLDAMREALRLNLQPIVLTSVTTAVGFLTLNFSISPPFNELGNMTCLLYTSPSPRD